MISKEQSVGALVVLSLLSLDFLATTDRYTGSADICTRAVEAICKAKSQVMRSGVYRRSKEGLQTMWLHANLPVMQKVMVERVAPPIVMLRKAYQDSLNYAHQELSPNEPNTSKLGLEHYRGKQAEVVVDLLLKRYAIFSGVNDASSAYVPIPALPSMDTAGSKGAPVLRRWDVSVYAVPEIEKPLDPDYKIQVKYKYCDTQPQKEYGFGVDVVYARQDLAIGNTSTNWDPSRSMSLDGIIEEMYQEMTSPKPQVTKRLDQRQEQLLDILN
jgi:hypothetical protein